MARRFEWDPQKAKANLAKHGVSFEQAELTFDDPNAVVEIDERSDYGEERLVRTAMVPGERFLFVANTERVEKNGDEVFRIISARKATRHERHRYQEGQP